MNRDRLLRILFKAEDSYRFECRIDNPEFLNSLARIDLPFGWAGVVKVVRPPPSAALT